MMRFDSKKVKWVAKDANGRVYYSTSSDKPYVGLESWRGLEWNNLIHISIPELEGLDWKDTLRRVLPDGSLGKALPDYKTDEVLIVSSFPFSEDNPLYLRRFSHFDERNRCICFMDGASSDTENTLPYVDWNYHKPLK